MVSREVSIHPIGGLLCGSAGTELTADPEEAKETGTLCSLLQETVGHLPVRAPHPAAAAAAAAAAAPTATAAAVAADMLRDRSCMHACMHALVAVAVLQFGPDALVCLPMEALETLPAATTAAAARKGAEAVATAAAAAAAVSPYCSREVPRSIQCGKALLDDLLELERETDEALALLLRPEGPLPAQRGPPALGP